MAEFFHGRRLRYQISVQIEDRWQLVAVVEDGRDELGRTFERTDLDRLETEIRSRAHAALATRGAKAVRVIRERIRPDGFILEEVFLFEEAAAVKPVERAVSNYAGPVPLCTDAEDLLTRPALRAIGLIMRPLLDRLGMTPIELVTLSAVNASVKRAENAISTAIARAARLQAAAQDVPVRDRTARIEALAEQCQARVRAANQTADPLKLDALGLDRFAAAIVEAYPVGEQRFRALRGIAAFIAGASRYEAKLERLLELNRPQLGRPATNLLDDAAACLVDHSDVVRMLLGHRSDLHAALLALAGLAEGTAPPGSEAPEAAAQLAALLTEGRLPQTRAALWDRLTRSLAGRRALGDGTPKTEQAAIAHLLRDLLPRLPEPFRTDAAASLQRRQTAALQAILDEME
ncbi:MAG: hypothetical protein WCC64_17595 [Aliidongia sp.]